MTQITRYVVLAFFAILFVVAGVTVIARDASNAGRPPATPAAHRMTFAECQAQGDYPGGRYAVEFDNGVCTVQRP